MSDSAMFLCENLSPASPPVQHPDQISRVLKNSPGEVENLQKSREIVRKIFNFGTQFPKRGLRSESGPGTPNLGPGISGKVEISQLPRKIRTRNFALCVFPEKYVFFFQIPFRGGVGWEPGGCIYDTEPRTNGTPPRQ